MNKRIGYINVILATFIWGLEPVIFKSISETTTFYIQGFIRFLSAWILLNIILTFYKPENVFKNDGKIRDYFILSLFLFAYNLLLLTGLKHSMANLASFIIDGIGPIISIIIAGLAIKQERDELKDRYTLLSILFGSIGTILMVGESKSFTLAKLDFGLVLIFVGQVLWAFYLVYYQMKFDQVHPLVLGKNVTGITAFLFFLAIIFLEQIELILLVNIKTVCSLMTVGIFIEVLGLLTFYTGLKRASIVEANIILLFTPLIGVFAAYFAFNETLNLMQIIDGGFIVMANVVLVMRSYNQRKNVME